MKLGNYDSAMARNRAARFLTTSIGEIQQLMISENIDFVYSGENPHPEGTIEHNAFKVVTSEYSSLEALKNE
jgi:hypothetical protein